MPLPHSPRSPRPPLMRDEAYRAVRELIVEGTLGPAERLRDGELARWLGVSRTPIREALVRLADEGLVELAPNRYTRVAPLEAVDAAGGFRIAGALHGLATELGGRSLGASIDQLGVASERFTWALWRADAREATAADAAFHGLLVELASDRTLAALLDRLEPRLRRLELATWPQIAANRPDRHAEALAALEAGNLDTAATLVAQEWRELGDTVAAALAGPAPAEG